MFTLPDPADVLLYPEKSSESQALKRRASIMPAAILVTIDIVVAVSS